MTNWIGVNQPVENSTDELTAAQPRSTPTVTEVPEELTNTEAQGWVFGEEGEVMPTTPALNVIPCSSSLTLVVCR